MSVDLFVYLNKNWLPTEKAWQDALQSEGFDFTFDEFVISEQEGFLPVVLNSIETGFEFYLEPLVLDDQPTDVVTLAIGDRDMVASFRFGGDEHELAAALCAAAVLAQITDGVYYDPQSDTVERGRELVASAKKTVAMIFSDDDSNSGSDKPVSAPRVGPTAKAVQTVSQAAKKPWWRFW